MVTASPSRPADARPPSVLLELVEQAEAGAGALNLGISAVGTLMAHAAVPIEDGSISADTVEALGWLLGELGKE